MEPIEYLKKEPVQCDRLSRMRAHIYRALCPMEILFSPSAEPIPCEQRCTLVYRPIRSRQFWAEAFGCAWFHAAARVPAEAAGQHVVVHIDLGGEGLVFPAEGSEPIAALTLDTSAIDRVQACGAKTVVEVSGCAEGGETVEYYIDAGFNGYYNNPAGHAYFRYAELCAVDDALHALYYDYLTVVSHLSACAGDAAERRTRLVRCLDEAWRLWADEQDTEGARAVLRGELQGKPAEGVVFTAVGHSHLDLAWLWPLRETKRKAARTFAHQLGNMARYPQYIYGASQPQQFAFLRARYPQEYAALQACAQRGQLECQGAMWVEADANLSSGEALIRQLLYGKRFFAREFGQDMRICWLPDAFGFNGNLPQILSKSGVPYFMTIKLSWNEHNRFPYRSFVWRGIDGSEVLAHIPPADNYNCDGSPADALRAVENYPERGVAPMALTVFGIGDGGGGPGEAHIEMLARQQQMQDVPAVRFGTAEGFFERLDTCRASLPTYEGELYLEKHQGTYTTQAYNKKMNRRCEYALQDVEALSAWARQRGAAPVSQQMLDDCWQEVLLYQFHDILPGSGIHRVYAETTERYDAIYAQLTAEKQRMLVGMAQGGGLSAFNPTSYARREMVRAGSGRWYKAELPAWGVAAVTPAYEPAAELHCTADTMENAYLRVRFAPGGQICSLVEKATGFEYAAGLLNSLVLYDDPKLPYNAWDIDWQYHTGPKTLLNAARQEIWTDGQRVVHSASYAHGATVIEQETELTAGGKTLRFRTVCHWQEELRMLRAEFEPAVFADRVKCDIQMGSLWRTTRDETLLQKAQFEICAHKYVDVSAEGRGLSLLNDCKYGHRVKNGRISLNLLRAPVFPDPQADRRVHEFTYALYPHAGACGVDTLREAYFLNKPAVLFAGKAPAASLASVSADEVVIETIKPAASGRGVILRLYESTGRTAECCLRTELQAKSAAICDMMENPTGPADLNALTFAPFEIKTIWLDTDV